MLGVKITINCGEEARVKNNMLITMIILGLCRKFCKI